MRLTINRECLRSVILLCLAIVIAACGGGGSGSSKESAITPPPNSGGNPENNALPDPGISPIEYQGQTGRALLTGNSALAFFNFAIANSFVVQVLDTTTQGASSKTIAHRTIKKTINKLNFPESYNAGKSSVSKGDSFDETIVIDQRQVCEGGGEFSLTGSVSILGAGSLELVYASCSEAGTEITGKVTIVTERRIVESNPSNYQLFDIHALEISFDAEKFTISGDEAYINFEDCQIGSETHSNLVIYSHKNDDYVRLENFVTKEPPRCFPNDYPARSEFTHGRIYLSELGFTDYNSVRNSDTYRDEVLSFYYELRGVGSNSAVLESDRQEVTDNINSLAWRDVVKLYVNESTLPNNERKVSLLPGYFELGLIESLDDADSDGIIDDWEVLHGLDPLNPNDADLDFDNDGQTNLIEFLYLGHPSEPSILPLSFDFSLGMRFSPEFYDDIMVGEKAGIETVLYLPNDALEPVSTEVEYTISDSAYFVDLPSYCSSLGPWTIRCTRSGYNNYGSVLYFKTNAPGTVTIQARVQPEFYDADLTNNDEIIALPVIEKQADLFFDIRDDEQRNIYLSYSPDEFIIPLNGEKHIRATLRRSGRGARNRTDGISFELAIPDNIAVTKARFQVASDTQAAAVEFDCETSGSVFCNVGSIDNGSSLIGELDLTVVGRDNGASTGTAEIRGDIIDTDPSNNTLALPFYVGTPLESLISEVNIAPSGYVLEIPRGVYTGQLSPLQEVLHVRPKPGDGGEVFIRGTINYDAAASGSISGLNFIEDSKVFVNNFSKRSEFGNVIFENNDVTGKFYLVSSSSNVQIRNNMFHDYIPVLSSAGYIRLSNVGAYNSIVNNVFSEISVDRLIEFTPSQVSADASLDVINNTFDSIVSVLEVSIRSELDYELNIINNIFSRSVSVIEFGDILNNFFVPTIDSNLLHEVQFETQSEVDVDFSNSVNGDPAFENRDQSNFSILSNSAGIDAANNFYAPLEDFKRSIRPVDGDGDGVAAPDIGAFEYER